MLPQLPLMLDEPTRLPPVTDPTVPLIDDPQLSQLRVPPHSLEAESSVLGGLHWTMPPGTGWPIW